MTQPTSTPYPFAKLSQNQIRVLHLSPGEPDEPLTGTIQHVNLESDMDFEAISYVWGSEAKPFHLTTPQGSVSITASLHSALRLMRRVDGQRLLWADALCINQQDNDEKSHQVRLMYQIYSAAKHTLIFLGEQANGSELVPKIMDEILDRKTHQKSDVAGTTKVVDVKPLSLLLSRPWFRRVWIIQECLAAKTVFVLCGSWQVSLQTLVDAVDDTFSYSGLSLSDKAENKAQQAQISQGSIALSTLDMGRDMVGTSGGQRRQYHELLDLLELFQGQESTRARDHVFSLLSLSDDTSDTLFDPDYDEPLEAVVRRYGRGFVQQGKALQLLASAGLTTHTQPDRFPSWVPDWTRKRPTRFFEGLASNDAVYHAGGTAPFAARYDIPTDELVLHGRMIDSVAKLVSFGDGTTHRRDRLQVDEEVQKWYLEACEALVGDCSNLVHHGTREELIWRTLIADRDFDGEQVDGAKLRQSYRAYRQEIGLPQRTEEVSDESDAHSEDATEENNPMDFSLPFITLSHMYHFCITRHGYAGIVPVLSQVDDQICILYGSPVPYVIRKSTTRSGEIYQLVGRCYIHEVMNGERVDDNLSKDGDIRLH